MPGPVFRFALTCLLAAFIANSTLRASPATAATLDPPPDSAEQLRQLARDPVWLALVHQARRRISRQAGHAFAEAGFFIAARGSKDPEAELRATQVAFLGDDDDLIQEARCRFPARYQFMVERGVIPDEPRGACPELERWRAQIGEFQLTVVFPEAFLGNPASMFGHTLLRFDPASDNLNPTPSELLGWTLDYSADAQGDRGATYLVRGLTGFYFGKFGIAPYYEKTKVYSDWQDRNIWEYPLSMGRPDRERLLLHVWELQDLALPYYFFTANCSERLMEVLEVGSPELGRGGGFPPLVAPVDTLRAIEQASSTSLGRPKLRPSPAAQLQSALGDLSRSAYSTVEGLALGRISAFDSRLEQYEPETRSRLLSLSYDLLRHSFLAGKVSEEDSRPRSYALLSARGRVGRQQQPGIQKPIEIVTTPPDEGHGTARVDLSGGIQDREGFIEIRLRPAYHSKIDAPGGFAEGGEIRALETAIRYYPDLDRVRLEEFVLLDITNASPWRRPFRPLAWHSEIGVRTRMVSSDRDRGLDTESVFRAQGGLGIALAPVARLHLYTFGELVLEAGPGLEGDAVAGPLVRSGLSWSTAKGGYTMRFEGIAGALAGKDTSAWLGAEFEQRVTLSEKWSAALSAGFERAYDVGHFEARLGLIRYF